MYQFSHARSQSHGQARTQTHLRSENDLATSRLQKGALRSAKKRSAAANAGIVVLNVRAGLLEMLYKLEVAGVRGR